MPNPAKLFNRAEAFKARGDYPGAFHHYLKAAEKKHELAQFGVALRRDEHLREGDRLMVEGPVGAEDDARRVALAHDAPYVR